jgi:hypothetical protein
MMHHNDNLRAFRRAAEAGKRRLPTAALACHWFNRNGRLECRWQADTNDAPIVNSDEGHTRGCRGGSSMPPRGRGFALAG